VGRRRIAPFALAVAVAAALLGGSAVSASAATVAESSCPEGVPAASTCGTLTVPEVRARPDSRTISMPYVVLKASSGAATAPPVVTMAGGPGQSSYAAAIALADDARIGATRDIIVLGQRGGIDSSNPLDCPAASSAYSDTFTTDDSPATEMTAVSVEVKNCIAAFTAAGGDVTAYTKTDMAADVVDLRQTLAIPVWTVFGDAWSTKVMQIVAVSDPTGVDAVVMNAFSPVDRDIKGDAYVALSSALSSLSASSHGLYPDLNADLAAAATIFSDKPVHGLMTNPISGAQRYYSLTGSDVVTIVQQALYDPATAAAVPYLLSRLAAGETDAINPFIPAALDNVAATSLGLYWVSSCRDEKPFWSADPTVPAAEGAADPTPVPLPVLTYLTAADVVCASQGLPPSPGETRAFGAVGQPTLIFASTTDPLVPVQAAQGGQAAFPNNQLVTLASMGRAGVTADPCGMDQLATWLAAPGTPVQTACIDGETIYPIIDGDSVHETSRVASVVAAIEDQNAFELTIPLIFGAFVLLWLVGWIIAVIVQTARREPFALLLVSGIAPVTGAVFLAAVWLVMSTTLAANPGFALVGVPTIVPWLGILLGVGFLGIIPVWRLGGRPTAALAASATIVWLAMIIWFVWIAVLKS